MKIELKVKHLTLAAEARIIRRLEKQAKLKGRTDQNRSLHEHRVRIVRNEARATNLARAYLKGQDYKLVENKTVRPIPPAVLDSAASMCVKYGNFDGTNRQLRDKLVDEWIKAA